MSDFKGKPTVVNFWASWCGPCTMEMPAFQKEFLESGNTINFIIVNMTDGHRETLKTAFEFISNEGYAFPVYYDTDSSAAITYQVYSIPTTYFIDAEGNIAAHAAGAINKETLKKGISMIKD